MLYFRVDCGPPARFRVVVTMAQASAESKSAAWLKAGEVCELAQVQSYVLRTWELEFPDLGVTKTPGGPRMYRPQRRRSRAAHQALVFGDGLTLAELVGRSRKTVRR